MTRIFRRIPTWPTTLKVPLVVAVLMVAVSVVFSNQILMRLTATQQKHLQELSGAYLDGLSSSLVSDVLRDDVWGIFDLLDRSRQQYAGLDLIDTIVAAKEGVVLAASDPRRFPSQQPVPASLASRFDRSEDLVLAEQEGRAFARRALAYQGRTLGAIYAEIDIDDLLVERREVTVALIATNAALTLFFAAFGYLAVRRMVKPIGILAAHLDRGRGGRVEPIPKAQVGSKHSEFGRLFRRYNAMVRALNERGTLAARLAEEEKLGSLGRLASGMAHEINNPLGGMFNAIDTIERHGDDPAVRRSGLRIVTRGLVGIRDVVRSALVAYKGSGAGRYLRSSDLDDLRFLVMHEVSRRQLDLMWHNHLPGETPVPAGPVRQAVLNLLLNACAVSPVGGRVSLKADASESELVIDIADQGPWPAGPGGLDVERRRDRCRTTRPRRGSGRLDGRAARPRVAGPDPHGPAQGGRYGHPNHDSPITRA